MTRPSAPPEADPGGTLPRLHVRTVPVDDPGDLVALLPPAPAHELHAWVRDGEGVVGWGRAAQVTTHGASRFRDAQAWWTALTAAAVVEDEVRLAGTGLTALGSLAYSARSAAGGTLVVPSVLVGRRGGTAWVTTAAPQGEALPEPGDLSPYPPAPAPADLSFADGSLSPARWMEAVAAAVDEIVAGGLDKTVLARDLLARAGAPVDVRHLLARLTAQYPHTWAFSVDGLVGATPEMLASLSRGRVRSRVLAGTIRRTGDEAHDRALAAELARSGKDLQEHEYAVRSVAERLAPHCDEVVVPDEPFVLHLPNVMHLASDVSGVLSGTETSLALAEALHPSAAVCGTPREAADALITRLEHMDRARYAGPVGWLSADGDGEWGIGLRSGEITREDPCQVRLFAGCGIVAGSDPAAELAESDAKLVPMRDALSS